jgi:hypothetical protein
MLLTPPSPPHISTAHLHEHHPGAGETTIARYVQVLTEGGNSSRTLQRIYLVTLLQHAA